MATGSGKTVVMAMLIAWQTLNKLASPRDARFSSRFLVVTPGITIRDRLRVLHPGDPGNYYDERDLVPPDLRGQLGQARIVIANYHGFLLKDAKEIKGVAAATRKLLLAGKPSDPFRETPDAMVSRVLRDLGTPGAGGRGQEIVVLNDEAHHCYQDRPLDGAGVLSAEQKAANEDARVWFRGLRSVARRVGIKAVYDMSATPFYLAGSGYREGYIFPWTVSDFSLMNAIESGIVKVPRTPVDDDASHELVTYLRLWDHIGDLLPRRKSAALAGSDGFVPPPELQGALESLYRSYEKSYAHWQRELEPLGEPPPVFIVVCPNTVVSKLVHDWIAGTEVAQDDGSVVHRPGNLALFGNSTDGAPAARPPTILVDSAQLESGEALKADFKAAAATELAAFHADYRRRNPGADLDKITDEDLLREVMNTVGKRGRLGESVRCVVSVAMLTEGWDANTVTHILGIRAFRSQLLCEQVAGRGLRRRSYAVNAAGRFDAEYANVYGIPFQFLPSDRPVLDPKPALPAIEVAAVPGREPLRITFPKLDGYRLEIPDAELGFDPGSTRPFVIGPGTVPTWTELAGIVGEPEIERDVRETRRQEVAYLLARRLLDSHFGTGQDHRPWLFPRLVAIADEWLARCVTVSEGYRIGYLRLAEAQAEAAEAIYAAITVQVGNRRERLRPMLRRYDPVGSTGDVAFLTRKATMPTEKSEALECELAPRVAAYVKNDHLGLTIPYVHKGRTHSYLPDFLLRLVRADGEDLDRVLVVEVSGGQKSPGPTRVKAQTARDCWCAAVNNHGGFGRWGYLEVTSMTGVREVLQAAIIALYADAPIIGDPDRLDFSRRDTAADVRHHVVGTTTSW